MEFKGLELKKGQFNGQNLSMEDKVRILKKSIMLVSAMYKLYYEIDKNKGKNGYEIRRNIEEYYNDVIKVYKDSLSDYKPYEMSSSGTLGMLMGYNTHIYKLEDILEYFTKDEIYSDNKKITINTVLDLLIKTIVSLASYIFNQFGFEDWTGDTEKITEVSDVIYYWITELKDNSIERGEEFDEIEKISNTAKGIELMMNTYNPYSSEFDEFDE